MFCKTRCMPLKNVTTNSYLKEFNLKILVCTQMFTVTKYSYIFKWLKIKWPLKFYTGKDSVSVKLFQGSTRWKRYFRVLTCATQLFNYRLWSYGLRGTLTTERSEVRLKVKIIRLRPMEVNTAPCKISFIQIHLTSEVTAASSLSTFCCQNFAAAIAQRESVAVRSSLINQSQIGENFHQISERFLAAYMGEFSIKLAKGFSRGEVVADLWHTVSSSHYRSGSSQSNNWKVVGSIRVRNEVNLDNILSEISTN